MTDYDYTARLTAGRRRHTERHVAIKTEWDEDPLTLGHLRALVAAADGLPDSADVDYAPPNARIGAGAVLAVAHSESAAECPACNGTGVIWKRPDGNVACGACGGTGEHIVDAEIAEEDQAAEPDTGAAADRAHDVEVDRANGVV